MSGAAFSVLRKRAVSCSFSSIYHLPAAGVSKEHFATIDNVVRVGILVPVVFFGIVGAGSLFHAHAMGRETLVRNGL